MDAFERRGDLIQCWVAVWGGTPNTPRHHMVIKWKSFGGEGFRHGEAVGIAKIDANRTQLAPGIGSERVVNRQKQTDMMTVRFSQEIMERLRLPVKPCRSVMVKAFHHDGELRIEGLAMAIGVGKLPAGREARIAKQMQLDEHHERARAAQAAAAASGDKPTEPTEDAPADPDIYSDDFAEQYAAAHGVDLGIEPGDRPTVVEPGGEVHIHSGARPAVPPTYPTSNRPADPPPVEQGASELVGLIDMCAILDRQTPAAAMRALAWLRGRYEEP